MTFDAFEDTRIDAQKGRWRLLKRRPPILKSHNTKVVFNLITWKTHWRLHMIPNRRLLDTLRSNASLTWQQCKALLLITLTSYKIFQSNTLCSTQYVATSAFQGHDSFVWPVALHTWRRLSGLQTPPEGLNLHINVDQVYHRSTFEMIFKLSTAVYFCWTGINWISHGVVTLCE